MIKEYKMDVQGDMVPVICRRCNGTGYLPEYSYINNGVCFACFGKAKFGMVPRKEAEKVLARRESARKARLAKKENERQEKIRVEEERSAKFREENKEFIKLVQSYDGSSKMIKNIQKDLSQPIIFITENQMDAVKKELEREKDLIMPPSGRMDIIKAKVLSRKISYNDYGSSVKVLIQCDGYRLFGSLPAAISDIQNGDTFTMVATIKPVEKGFGYYSRPSKAKLAS